MTKLNPFPGQKFSYISSPELPNITKFYENGKGYYDTPDGKFVSITTILAANVPSEIISWRKAMGDSVADYIMRKAAARGKTVHSIIERYLSNHPPYPMQTYGLLPWGIFRIMRPALDNISDVRGIEIPIYSRNLRVAGTADTIADYDGVPSIIDYKTTTKLRNSNSIRNHLLQCAFYGICWEELTREKLEQIVIIMGAEDGNMAVFKEKLSDHVQKVKKLIQDYRAE